MLYYFAPLEGITDNIYRQLHHRYFPGVDRYYTPFFSPTIHRSLTAKEQRELPLADSLDYCLVPQLLTKNAEDFLWMAQQCADRGYNEVNLNLGCPSGTVTAKGKGAGMLREPEALDRFLESIYSRAPLPISVKTRIGYSSAEEFPVLLEIFNRYPIKELTIHPRIRSAFYGGSVQMDAFDYALKHSRNPLCYNGDITSVTQFKKLSTVDAVMIGRGLVANPGMLSPSGTDIRTLSAFYDALLEAYSDAFGSARNTMFRLKEHWQMLLPHFENSEQFAKQLRKTTDIFQYRQITQQILQTCPFKP